MNDRPEKYVRIRSQRQVALKSSSGCQNNVPTGATVPKGNE
jgi:hypothetical protein